MREPVIFKTTDGDKQLTFKIYPLPSNEIRRPLNPDSPLDREKPRFRRLCFV